MTHLPNGFTEFVRQYPATTYKAKSVLLHPNTSPNEVFFLQAGKVSLSDISPKGDEVVLLPLEPYSIFPLRSLLTGMTSRHFYKCETRTYIRKIPVRDMRSLMATNPEIQKYMLMYLHHRAEGLLSRVLHMVSASAIERLLYELVLESELFGKHHIDGSCLIEIKNDYLARRTGLKPETVSRELQKLKKQRIIRAEHGGLRIVNVQSVIHAMPVVPPAPYVTQRQ